MRNEAISTQTPAQPLTVTIGGTAAPVISASALPAGLAGLKSVSGILLVGVQVPAGTASGNQPLVVTVGSATSPFGVTVNVW